MKHAIFGLAVLSGAVLLPAAPGDLVWSFQTGGNVGSSPAVSGGYVYVGSCDDKVYCLDAATGGFVWSCMVGDNVYSCPAVSGGRVYVGSSDTKVYCLDAATGGPLWFYQTNSTVSGSPAVSNGSVFVGSGDNKVYCLDAETGALVWSYQTGGDVYSSPAVSGGCVYVGSYDNKVYCLDAETGGLVWSYETGDNVSSSPAVDGGHVYVGSNDHKVYCLDAATGGLVWSYETGDDVYHCSPAADGDHVYVGSADNKVYCLDAATGAVGWSYQTGGDVYSSPAVSGGYVYAGSYGDDTLQCLDAATGGLAWSYRIGGHVYSSPAVSGGYVYVGGYDDVLYCFEAGAGDPGKWPMFKHDARGSGQCACARAEIGPAGGTLDVDDVSSPLDGAKVVFPAGVLAAQAEVTIAETVPQAAVPGGAIGVPLDLAPDGLALTGPVTVSVPHAAATAHTMAAQVYWWDLGAGQWSNQGISNVVHDGAADPHVVSFDAEHFTTFQVAGTVPPAPPPPAASGDDGGGNGGGGGLCFVATAAYGSEFASEVESLKLLRDGYLVKCAAGRLLVGLYYDYGPYAAHVVAGRSSARACVRLALRPLVSLAASAEVRARE